MDLRRVVTGETPLEMSMLVSDGRPPLLRVPASVPGVQVTEFWRDEGLPPRLRDPADPVCAAASAEPVERGFAWRTFELGAGASAESAGCDRLELVVVVDGEARLTIDDDERTLSCGDCVVFQGTRARWQNLGEVTCVLSVLTLAAARA